MERDATVLFADVAGSTRLYHDLGDEAGRARLLACLETVRRVVVESGGRVIERIGDELLCLFPNPNLAAQAAMEVHLKLGIEAAQSGERPLRMRLGFEHGPVLESEEGIFGSTVHVAARVAARAKGGQSLTTGETMEQLDFGLRDICRFSELAALKGVRGQRMLYDLVWSPMATTRLRPRPPCEAPAAGPVELDADGTRYRVDEDHPRLELGRDPACDVVMTGDLVSQFHASIVREPARVMLQDVSTNGTIIVREGAAIRRLYRATARLMGHGQLWLGGEPGDEGAAVLTYRCDAP